MEAEMLITMYAIAIDIFIMKTDAVTAAAAAAVVVVAASSAVVDPEVVVGLR